MPSFQDVITSEAELRTIVPGAPSERAWLIYWRSASGPVEQAPSFNELLRAIDEADRKLKASRAGKQDN